METIFETKTVQKDVLRQSMLKVVRIRALFVCVYVCVCCVCGRYLEKYYYSFTPIWSDIELKFLFLFFSSLKRG